MIKKFRLAAIAALIGYCPTIFALGLGYATVNSYLNQPLDVRINLISRSEAELATVTAGMASADDFAIIGLNRAALSVPLEFIVHRDLSDPHIQVTSSLPVRDPVVQLVLEVVWSSGRMLRQYTLFIDPPTFSSIAPPPVLTPEPAAAVTETRDRQATVAESGPEVPTSSVVEQLPSAPEQRVEADDSRTSEVPLPEPEEGEKTAVVEEDFPASEPAAAGDDSADIAERSEEALAEDGIARTAPETEVVSGNELTDETESLAAAQEEEQLSGDGPDKKALEETDSLTTAQVEDQEPASGGEVYGPVRRGQTLWGIATEWSRGMDITVNQVMLAIQRQNPRAFNRGNINSLKRGEILRMPAVSQINALMTWRVAMLEVMRQEDVYLNQWNNVAGLKDVPAVADIEAMAAAPEQPEVEETAFTAQSRLELVPPSEAEDSPDGEYGQGTSGAAGVENGESVVEELARTEEELANAQQENIYLNERIRELETELERRQGENGVAVADTTLAEMEDRLRELRQDGTRDDQQIAVVPPRDGEPWYTRLLTWMIGLVILLVAAVVWWLRSRKTADFPLDEQETVQVITEEAEEILKVLDPSDEAGSVEDDKVIDPEPHGPLHRARPLADEEAVELDSDDPETKLDLARAYISMGDIEAARAMLEEVLECGNQDQVSEAREMMEEI